MIVYRLTPYTRGERYIFCGEGWGSTLGPYPTKRDLVEYAADRAIAEGKSYRDYIAYRKTFDPRFANIEAPEAN